MKAGVQQSSGNFFGNLPTSLPEELIETVFQMGHVRIERIVSTGQSSPPDFWYDQPEGEWVVLLSGGAALEFQEEPRMVHLEPGDYVFIPPHCKQGVSEYATKDIKIPARV
jgi:cupin 2 domain-containing protein